MRSLLTSLDLATLGSAGVTVFGIDANDISGRSVSNAGDVNGDGVDDFVIGADFADGAGNATPGAGETYLIFGGENIPTTINLANLGTAGVTIFGIDGNDFSGCIVSNAGDINGDGFDDLFIGSQNGDGAGNAKENVGESYIVFGKSNFPATINLGSLGTAGITFFGADNGDLAGLSLSQAGDVNNDNFDDFLIGALRGDGSANDEADAGEAYLIFGASTLPTTIDLSNLGGAGTVIYGADAGDGAGLAVSGAGDVNGDNFDDLIIGAYRGDGAGNALADAGEAYIIFGAANLPATIDLGSLGAAGVSIFGVDANDRAGRSVSDAGDVNSDGFADVLIGSDQADGSDNTKSLAGESYLIFGGATLPATINLSSLGTAGVTMFGADADDAAGLSVSGTGDINGDGFDDFLVGALRADGPNNSRLNSGESYLIFGAATLPATIELANLGTVGFTIFGAGPGDDSGFGISGAGDVNDDGFDDMLVSSRNAEKDRAANNNAGISYIIFGGVARVGGPAAVWVKNDPPVLVMPDAELDSSFEPDGGTLTISMKAVGSKKKLLDEIGANDSSSLGTFSEQFANGIVTLQIQLGANATPENIQAFLRSFTFATTGKGLKTPTRTVDVRLAEAGGSESSFSQTILVFKKPVAGAPAPRAAKPNTCPDVVGRRSIATDHSGRQRHWNRRSGVAADS